MRPGQALKTGVVQGGYRPHGLRAAKQSRGRVPTGTSSETFVAVSAWGRRRETAGQRASPGGRLRTIPSTWAGAGLGGCPAFPGTRRQTEGICGDIPGAREVLWAGPGSRDESGNSEKKGRPAAQRGPCGGRWWRAGRDSQVGEGHRAGGNGGPGRRRSEVGRPPRGSRRPGPPLPAGPLSQTAPPARSDGHPRRHWGSLLSWERGRLGPCSHGHPGPLGQNCNSEAVILLEADN